MRFVVTYLLHKNSWMQDPRCKHEYLDKPKPLAMIQMMKVTNIFLREIEDTPVLAFVHCESTVE